MIYTNYTSCNLTCKIIYNADDNSLYKDVVVFVASVVTVKPKIPHSLLAQPTVAPTEVTMELA